MKVQLHLAGRLGESGEHLESVSSRSKGTPKSVNDFKWSGMILYEVYAMCFLCSRCTYRENYRIQFSCCGLENLKNLKLPGRKGTALFLFVINNIWNNHVFFDYKDISSTFSQLCKNVPLGALMCPAMYHHSLITHAWTTKSKVLKSAS